MKQRKRGYLLLEVTVAGAIAAVAVASLLTMLGDSRTKSISVARDITARGIVARGLERARAKGFLGVTNIAPTPEPNVTGQYLVETRVVSGSEVLFSAQTSAYKDVTVIVTHTAGSGVVSESALVRLYE